MRIAEPAHARVFDREVSPRDGPPGRFVGRRFRIGDPVLDLVTVLGMIALFALIGVLGKAVEKL
ncbi:hypothetical protein PQI23_05340 [Leucobacter sp. USCH14]|uniref:hypothetical protein n=1 Tax=Leucobacter sp. USCH14 TaxID=3024838 RepID=UPI0030AB82A5